MTTFSKLSRTQIERAALTAYSDAGRDGRTGMSAVLWVLRNRIVNNSALGGISDSSGHIFSENCSTDCWRGGIQGHSRRLAAEGANLRGALIYRQALALAHDILGGNPTVRDPTGGCTRYARVGDATPSWAIGRTPDFEYGYLDYYKF